MKLKSGLILFFHIDGQPSGCSEVVRDSNDRDRSFEYNFNVSCVIDTTSIPIGSHMLEVYSAKGIQ